MAPFALGWRDGETSLFSPHKPIARGDARAIGLFRESEVVTAAAGWKYSFRNKSTIKGMS